MIIVYLSEAHPTNGWRLTGPNQPVVDQHETIADRLKAVELFLDITRSKTDAPVYVDLMENEIEKLFKAHPERLVIIDGDEIAFIGGVGPFFYSVEETEAALVKILQNNLQ